MIMQKKLEFIKLVKKEKKTMRKRKEQLDKASFLKN